MLGVHGPGSKGETKEEHPKPQTWVDGKVGGVGAGQEGGAAWRQVCHWAVCRRDPKADSVCRS